MKFWTESGSTYEVSGTKIRRINDRYIKRGDETWVELLNNPKLVAGQRTVLITEPLGQFGPDNYGSDEGGYTHRVTSPITRIEM